MKYFLFVVLLLSSLCAQSQETGSLYVTLTVPSNPDVGYMGSYLVIKSVDTGETKSAFLNGPSLTAYAFNDLPLGEYQFQTQGYDAIGCAGVVSDITTHQVYAPREPLDVIVASVRSAVDPQDPVGDCADDPNCEVVSN